MRDPNRMRMSALVFLALALPAAVPAAHAADAPPSIITAARCAPRASAATVPLDVLRIIGSQDTTTRSLYGTRDLLIINAGTARGVLLGQQYMIRHPGAFGDRAATPVRAISTGGWLRIVAANDATAIGLVEFACDGIERGDYLEAYVEPVLPPNLDRTDTTGELDFSAPARVLFGDNERLTGGTGDYMAIDTGSGRGVDPGARFAIYRDLRVAGVPITPLGEAVVVFADADTAIVRVTRTRDAVRTGDLMIPRKK